MKEAQQMMNDPAFQAQMKKMSESQGFQQHMKASQDMLKDPEKVKELESKMQEKLEEGNKLLEKAKTEEATGEKGGEEAVEEAAEGDKKEAAAVKKDDVEDEMPDIPSLNLN
jgi:hypothetical protein